MNKQKILNTWPRDSAGRVFFNSEISARVYGFLAHINSNEINELRQHHEETLVKLIRLRGQQNLNLAQLRQLLRRATYYAIALEANQSGPAALEFIPIQGGRTHENKRSDLKGRRCKQ